MQYTFYGYHRKLRIVMMPTWLECGLIPLECHGKYQPILFATGKKFHNQMQLYYVNVVNIKLSHNRCQAIIQNIVDFFVN